MNLYALRHVPTGKLVGFTIRANGDDAEFCNSTTVELDTYGESIWVTNNRTTAEKAASESTPWYNSCVESPKNPYVGQLEIVEYAPAV